MKGFNVNRRELRNIWIDSSFGMRAWAKYSITVLIFLSTIFLNLVVDLFDEIVDSKYFQNMFNKTEWLREKIFNITYK